MYECRLCGYTYHETDANKSFSELGGDYRCPLCGATKGAFAQVSFGGRPVKLPTGHA